MRTSTTTAPMPAIGVGTTAEATTAVGALRAAGVAGASASGHRTTSF